MARTKTSRPFARYAVGAALLAAVAGVVVDQAYGDSVVQFTAAKSLPQATVDVVDPESGQSAPAGSDVALSVGDIILFRFAVQSTPDSGVRGVNAYVTEYVPPGTEVVGVRFLDANGVTLEPRRAGLAVLGCIGNASCSTLGANAGSVAQLYADTGAFFFRDTEAGELATGTPVPDNAFLTLDNGIDMTAFVPRSVDPTIGQLLNDTSGPRRAHNAWDWAQVRAYGGASSTFTNNGLGVPRHLYGSPVAGPQTHYQFEISQTGAGDTELAQNSEVGPWQRIKYPGSQIGSGIGGTTYNSASQAVYGRAGIDTTLGTDVTPLNPVSTPAVRFAAGEAWAGELRYVEVALRVLQVPIDPTFGTAGGNVNCGESFGADLAAEGQSEGDDSPWSKFLPHPACVFVRLKLDLAVDKPIADSADQLNYTIDLKNLSVANETNPVLRFKYYGAEQAFLGATPPPTSTGTCPAPDTDKECLFWNLGTGSPRRLAPGDELSFDVTMDVQGQGPGTNTVAANYVSDELVALDDRGHTVNAVSVVRPIAAPVVTLANASDVTTSFAAAGSNTWVVTGTIVNQGTNDWTQQSLTIDLPTGFALSNPTTGTANQLVIGGVTETCDTNCTSASRTFNLALGYAEAQSRTFSFRVTVPAGATAGLYDLGVRTTGTAGLGDLETSFPKLVTVPVGAVRTQKPVIACPVIATAPSISGTSEPSAAVAVLFNLQQRDTATASGAGAWTVSSYPATFGTMYGGLEIRATAQAPGELRSELSDSCVVTGVKQCNDGLDNDGDGASDFPADVGCTSAADNDESNPPPPQCSDGIDNDGTDGADYPRDPKCDSPQDTTESGTASCADNLDNDGDGTIDFDGPGTPDSDCSSANDRERTLRACQDGIDNDSPADGLIDFPADPDCHSPFDDSEFALGSTPSTTRPRILLAVDSSGSMNWNTCTDTFTGGDGSLECPGADVACAACGTSFCGNPFADDSRLFQVKSGLSNVVAAFGEIEYGLMKFEQRDVEFACPTALAGLASGGYQGGGVAPCDGGFNAGELLAGFAPENEQTILDFMDHADNYPGLLTSTPPPYGADLEIRGSGTTPLGGILNSAKAYLEDVRADDLRVACRPYRVILVTDGAETCGGDPVSVAASLYAAEIPVTVIGFATPDPAVIANLNAIARAGSGGVEDAVFVDDEAELSAALAEIIADSIRFELCNGADDDCDVAIDEDFPEVGAAGPPVVPPATCDNGQEGVCFRTGSFECAADGAGSVCNAPTVTPGATELCNDLDDDCDGLTDEGLGATCTCSGFPELCNGRDDDCDSVVDEGTLPGVGNDCGFDVGLCEPGTLACLGGTLVCQGDTGPATEVCDDADNDCDTFVDELVEVCYDFATGCVGGDCEGLCRTGIRTCDDNLVACVGDVGPVAELCNGLDDDCDGTTDDGLSLDGVPLGGVCDNGAQGICFATGTVVCDGAGGLDCTAPTIPPGIEVCNGFDDDCDGAVDETLGAPIGQPCGGGACGSGVFVCNAGVIECSVTTIGGPEECNGIDDNCNGLVDENVPGYGGDCVPPGFEAYGDVGECEFGTLACLAGGDVCQGYVGPSPDVPCNGIDEDCDGADDQTCPGDQACIDDACRGACEPGEFPCPFGFYCQELTPGERYCLPDPCVGLTCGAGETCDQDTGTCVSLCADVTCPTGTECINGLCRDCFTLGCPDGQRCVLSPDTDLGACTDDPCAGVTCDEGEFCRDGACVATTCDPACPSGQNCVEGTCIDDPCVDVFCPEGRICDPTDGQCTRDFCDSRTCDPGEACNPFTGECIIDPCPECPAGLECVIAADDTASCRRLPPPPEETVFAGGGGCAASGSPSGGALALLAAVGLLARRRRRR